MARTKYLQLQDNEWCRPFKRKFLEQCCDCGLVHEVDFRIVEGKHVEFRARRHKRATAAVRRTFKFSKEVD